MTVARAFDRAGAGEFRAEGAVTYDRRTPLRWVLSHLLQYWPLLLSFFVAAISTNVLFSLVPTLTGRAFDLVLSAEASRAGLSRIALTI
ncbi:MAG TPA: hypothetical protein VFD39_01465, partial [Trueperaceae bacterium]|nr:hypothetical protein [Trueperaceae bacterium]